MATERIRRGAERDLRSRRLTGVVLGALAMTWACSSGELNSDHRGGDGGGVSTGGQGTGVAGAGGSGAAHSGGGSTSTGGDGGGGRLVIDGPTPPLSALGFYDIDANGSSRAIRNDLSGNVAGMVQFAQSHTVDPSGNDARNHPTLIAERAALLLVTPQQQDVEQLEVEWSVDGKVRGRSRLAHPHDIPRSDSINGDGRPDVVYSKRAWSLVLPWEDVVPGLALTIIDDQGNEGQLAASAIEFAAPAELVLKVMRLGMLTDPPVSDDHWMVIDPVRAASDYFETQPIAQLVLGSYDSVRLDRVMVRSGTIYTSQSSTAGGVYDGDMRQDCAKASYSGGVNNADQGIVSSAMSSESNPRTTAQVVIHHAQGNYTNGVQGHGLSGGAGIGTLLSSTGNELTHELGHNWGLGHYPGESGGNYFWAAHHHESGWGFVQRRWRMRANLDWTGNGAQTVTNGVASNVTWNNGTYAFNNDPMSGAIVSSSISRVTHHTGYSARLSQQFFDRGIISADSPTGYVKWNKATRQLESLTPAANVLKPSQIGVPVYTFWGGYDPNTAKGLLYPALRGNYGHVFELPKPPASGDACWVEVALASGSKRQVALSATRHVADSVNKLHFNLPQSDAPQTAKLFCRLSGTTTELDSVAIPTPTGAQAPAVRVGKDAGFIAYQDLELEHLGQLLEPLTGDEIPEFSSEQWDLLDKLYDRIDVVLSGNARTQAHRLIALFDSVRVLDSWMTEHADALDAQDADKLAELTAKLHELGLAHSDSAVLPPTQAVQAASGGTCLTAASDRSVSMQSCDGSAEQQFVFDARGALHPLSALERCLTGGANNSPVALGDCDRLKDSQSWTSQDDGTIRLTGRSGFGLDRGANVLLYGIHGGANQLWSPLSRTSSLLLALLSSYNLPRLALVLE